jgi:hypothetical protein
MLTEIVREKVEELIKSAEGYSPARIFAFQEGKTMHDLVDERINAMTPLQLLDAIDDAFDTLREEGRL